MSAGDLTVTRYKRTIMLRAEEDLDSDDKTSRRVETLAESPDFQCNREFLRAPSLLRLGVSAISKSGGVAPFYIKRFHNVEITVTNGIGRRGGLKIQPRTYLTSRSQSIRANTTDSHQRHK